MVSLLQFASAMLMFLGIKMFTLIGSVQGAIDGKFLSVPAVVLILLSLLCLTIGILGCAGASVENRKTQAGVNNNRFFFVKGGLLEKALLLKSSSTFL